VWPGEPGHGEEGLKVATDEELLQAIQTGDTDSLGALVTRWERPLFRFVYRLLPRKEDARDICQETFLRVLKKSHRFKTGSRYSTWMYQIALNLCRDQCRRAQRWNRVITETPELPDRPSGPYAPEGADPARTVERREKASAVLQALDRLPPEQREVVVLKEFEGLKFREIAEILGCPESTVKSRMYYGLNGVRSALVGQGITEP
jgi:RNA polymerase sigma-70 factor (ECF subfamily)